MEVSFPPELEKKLRELATRTGRPADELVQVAVAGFVDHVADTRDMLDRRYDAVKSGHSELVPGEEALERLHERIEARRNDAA